MRDTILKTLGLSVSTASMLLVAGIAHAAAPLVSFSNGAVADADDVNGNFTELESRINTISLTPGPKGDQGIQGTMGLQGNQGLQGIQGVKGDQGLQGTQGIKGDQGPQGTQGVKGDQGLQGIQGVKGDPGAGAATPVSWAGFGSTAWTIKVFKVTDPTGSFDKETRTYTRTPTNATTGTTQMIRHRTFAGAFRKYQILQFSYDTAGDILLNQMDTYQSDTTTLNNTIAINGGIRLRHNNMAVGMNWATAAQVTRTDVNGGGAISTSFVVDSRSLIAVEDITVLGVAYTGCHKILSNRSADVLGRHFQRISWYCPGAGTTAKGNGLVKFIQINTNANVNPTTGFNQPTSRMLEFDPTQSTLAP